jgi:chromosomal replication initiator protein
MAGGRRHHARATFRAFCGVPPTGATQAASASIPRWYIRPLLAPPGSSSSKTFRPPRPRRGGVILAHLPIDHAAPDAIWNRLQGELRRAVADSTYRLWLDRLELRALHGDHVVIAAPREIHSWVGRRYARILQACAAAVIGPGATVGVVPLEAPGGSGSAAEPRRPSTTTEPFNPKYTFEQFVIGDTNRLAHAAALAVAELPGQAYNPLFIYGPPGLGKTHLLHAIANYLTAHEHSVSVRYTTVEGFTNHFVHALQSGTLERFKSLYRETDVLVIDDVQFLESKARTEEEFFHTFNALYETGAQLVLTSDRLPKDLRALEDRLRERFEAGLVCDIGSPDLPTRLTILHKRAAHDGIVFEDDAALRRIAERMTTNIRALEGALIRVVAYHSLTREPIDAALVDRVIDELYPEARRARRSVRDIQQATCDALGVTLDELRSPSRVPRLTFPRQIAMYLARELTDASLPAIGREFGGRNHATVLHAWRRTGERIVVDARTSEVVGQLARQLSGGQ